MPAKANVLGDPFVLCIKNIGSKSEVYKARYVVQGQRDKEKNWQVHPSTNLRQSSVRLTMSLEAVFEFRIWSYDVTQAYLQADDKLQRLVYIKPTNEFGLKGGQLLQLVQTLYGLSDVGDYWDSTMANHLRKEIGMQQASLDRS